LNLIYAQENLKIQGVITDQVTGEPIIGATIKQKNTPENTALTNFEGRFILQV
jgi:hypothetical protein